MNGYEQRCRTRAGGNTPTFCHLLQMRSLDTLVYQARQASNLCRNLLRLLVDTLLPSLVSTLRCLQQAPQELVLLRSPSASERDSAHFRASIATIFRSYTDHRMHKACYPVGLLTVRSTAGYISRKGTAH
jgi:hypothetical protein